MLSGQTDGKVSTVTLAHALRVNKTVKTDVEILLHKLARCTVTIQLL